MGPVSLKIFPTEFKFDGNLILLSPKFEQSDCHNIFLHDTTIVLLLHVQNAVAMW